MGMSGLNGYYLEQGQKSLGRFHCRRQPHTDRTWNLIKSFSDSLRSTAFCESLTHDNHTPLTVTGKANEFGVKSSCWRHPARVFQPPSLTGYVAFIKPHGKGPDKR